LPWYRPCLVSSGSLVFVLPTSVDQRGSKTSGVHVRPTNLGFPPRHVLRPGEGRGLEDPKSTVDCIKTSSVSNKTVMLRVDPRPFPESAQIPYELLLTPPSREGRQASSAIGHMPSTAVEPDRLLNPWICRGGVASGEIFNE
jgi:hypothetical protein